MKKDKFRSPEAVAHYMQVMAKRGPDYPCALCIAEPLKEYTHWKVMKNDFPYDLLAEKHDLLVSKRHCNEEEFTLEEREEATRIKAELAGEYGYFFEVSALGRSIPAHFHLHLMVAKAMPGSHAASFEK